MENQVKSFEQACEVLGRTTALPEVSTLPEKHQKAIIAHYKLVTICEAANFIENGNKHWEPNWKNSSEYKYYPWFWVDEDDKKPSGVGLSYSVCAHTHPDTPVGSRLCFKTSELARYIGKTFIETYQEYLLM